MSWFFLTLTSALTLSVANVLRRVLMRDQDTDPYGTTVFFFCASCCAHFWRGAGGRV